MFADNSASVDEDNDKNPMNKNNDTFCKYLKLNESTKSIKQNSSVERDFAK